MPEGVLIKFRTFFTQEAMVGPYFLSFSGFSEKTKKYERRVNERTHGGFSVRDYFILCSSYSICQDYSISHSVWSIAQKVKMKNTQGCYRQHGKIAGGYLALEHTSTTRVLGDSGQREKWDLAWKLLRIIMPDRGLQLQTVHQIVCNINTCYIFMWIFFYVTILLIFC